MKWEMIQYSAFRLQICVGIRHSRGEAQRVNSSTYQDFLITHSLYPFLEIRTRASLETKRKTESGASFHRMWKGQFEILAWGRAEGCTNRCSGRGFQEAMTKWLSEEWLKVVLTEEWYMGVGEYNLHECVRKEWPSTWLMVVNANME